ncbi:MAG TPA: 7TM diverse intracellular signaling domain-containing protein, partial [Pseudogracilibacillus sp.]|nr:7TM diverse intracellular signaling domain-containing protein [Pseudogracilibacillus sp.]
MEKSSRMTFCIVFIASIFMFISPFQMKAHSVTDEGVLILTNETEMVDLYEVMYILSDNETKLSVYDIASGAQDGSFYPAEQFPTKFGFFDIAKWIKFKIENSTDLNEWYVEFAFPLIYQIHLYEESSDGITKLVTGGAHFPFAERELYHRFFVYSLDIPPGETRTFYARVHGGADLHPPIRFWHKDSFVEASHTESGYLGIFYGMIVVMIVYNLFLYISLRIRTYLFYVLSIFFTLLAQLALNGLGFKYLWPTFPAWNTMAVPFLASTAFIFIILFTRDFLDTEKHARIFHKLSYTFISLHVLTIILLFIEHYAALNVMLCSAFITSSSVIVTSIICLFRGVREARFFIVGWFIFLGGVGITILERAALIPYSLFTEYAGQWALSIEVVILSFALADKINIIRKEKERVAQAARRSQELVVESLQK